MEQTQQGKTCEMGGCGGCTCPHHKMVPLFLFLIGLTFLLKAMNIVTAEFANLVWPILLMLGALQKMFKGMCKCCSK